MWKKVFIKCCKSRGKSLESFGNLNWAFCILENLIISLGNLAHLSGSHIVHSGRSGYMYHRKICHMRLAHQISASCSHPWAYTGGPYCSHLQVLEADPSTGYEAFKGDPFTNVGGQHSQVVSTLDFWTNDQSQVQVCSGSGTVFKGVLHSFFAHSLHSQSG